MSIFSPAFLEKETGGFWSTAPEKALRGFSVDTRTLKAGQVFVALRTDKRDGHDFLDAAQAAGAGAAIVARKVKSSSLPQLVVEDPLKAFHKIAAAHRAALRTRVIGVTGSAGKTSTKNLLALLLSGAPSVLATEGNFNNHIGVPLTLTRIDAQTHTDAVVEAGINQAGEMRDLGEMIQPDAAIVTLVGPAHLERLGSLENIAKEKSELLRHVRAGGLAVFPASAWSYGVFQKISAECRVALPRGTATPRDAAKNVRFVSFEIRHHDAFTELRFEEGRAFRLRRVSSGMAQNAVLSLILAAELGVPDALLQERLLQWQPAALRGELRAIDRRLVYLDCYNANPLSMYDSLEIFAELAPQEFPRMYILGGMEELGEDAARYHLELGKKLKLRREDCALAIGPHAEEVVRGYKSAPQKAARVEAVASIEDVAAQLKDFYGAVFVKGSRRYQLEKLFTQEPLAADH